MLNPLWLLFSILVWLKKTTCLPKLYLRISSKRGTPVKDVRQIKRYGLKKVKLKLDIKFFETCANLDICPQFLKFKAPNLKIYKNTKDLYCVIVLKKLKEIMKDLGQAESSYIIKKAILQNLRTIEKLCLISILIEKFQATAKNILATYKKKLLHLWLRERRKSSDFIKNLNSRSLTIEEEDALRFELDNHILTKKLQTDDIKAQIEKLFYFINKGNKLVDDNFKDEVKFMFKKFVNADKRICSYPKNVALHNTLKNLAMTPELKSVISVKGRG